MANEAQKVFLYVYDLSNGLAASLSPALLGKQLDGIWHTSIVIHDKEYYFGGGIATARAGTTPYGRPVQKIELGETYLPADVIQDLLNDIRHRFSESSYCLLSNNCNNFTDEFAKLLLGKGIPEHIVKLPDEVLSTPFGQMIKPMLAGLESQLASVNQSQPAPTPPAVPPPASSSVPNEDGIKSEVEETIRREFSALVAEGSVTPNQAAVMALEKVRAIFGKGQDRDHHHQDKSQA